MSDQRRDERVDELLVSRHEPSPPTQDPVVSVAIPTLNGGALLHELIAALHDQEIIGEIEVLIADSESDDGSIDAALRSYPKLRIFTVERARFNHGLVRNALIRRARAPKVALFSQDARPMHKRYLKRMAKVLNDENIAGVYARQQPRPGADPLTIEMLERWTPAPAIAESLFPVLQSLAEGSCLTDLPPIERMQVSRFDNVASMVRREVLDDIPFPARSFGEDIAWGALVLSAGFKLAYLPSVSVAHHHPPRWHTTFERNRVAHRQARAEFGLHAVPSLSQLALALISGVPNDLRAGPLWALRGLPRRGAALLGQWAGARDVGFKKRQGS